MRFDEFFRRLRNPMGKISFQKLTTERDQSLIELEDINRSTQSPKSIQLEFVDFSDSEEASVRPRSSDDGFVGSSNDFDRKIYNSPTQDISQSRHSSKPPPSLLKSVLGLGKKSRPPKQVNDDPALDRDTPNGQDLLRHSSGSRPQDEDHCPEIELLGSRSLEQRNKSNGCGLRGIRLYLILAMIAFVITITVAVTRVYMKDSNGGHAGEENKTKGSNLLSLSKPFPQNQDEFNFLLLIPDVKEMYQPAENHTNDPALMKMLTDNVTVAPPPKSPIPHKMKISPELLQESYKTALSSFTTVVESYDNQTPQTPDYSSNESQLERHAHIMELAYHDIVKKLNLSIEQADQGDNLLENATLPPYLCPGLVSNEPQCDKIGTQYRSLDGTCNHLNKNGLKWGSVNEPYRRFVFPYYEDGVSLPRSRSIRGKISLPSARLVSQSVHIDINESNKDETSMMVPLWAQFISHDVMHTAKSVLESDSDCCKAEPSSHQTQSENCFAILVPPTDSFYRNKTVSCLDFLRAAPHASCNFGPREQINKATSFIDASQIYGVTSEILKPLRVEDASKKGQMKLELFNGTYLLPGRKNSADNWTTLCLAGQEDSTTSPEGQCFMGGDNRVNEIATITALQTIWVRQHNQLAQKLSDLNKHWTDEVVFQETRRIIIAQIQHITFTEFLPVILEKHKTEKDLTLLSNYSNPSYYSDYDVQLNPGISNEFSIAFEFYISMIQGYIKLKTGPNQDNLKLYEMMLNPFLLKTEVGLLDKLLMGVATQPARKVDALISEQFTNHMYQLPNNTYGTDMVALIIQKGRDQGIPPYLEVATKKCGLQLDGKNANFSSLKKFWGKESLKRVSSIYESVGDIDLFTGLLSELPVKGGRLGPTLSCIISDQFSRLRKGDMFWYDGDISLKHFSLGQLDEIRKTTLTKIICKNSDKIRTLQPKVMLLPGPSNEAVQCVELPNIKLDAWKETKHKFLEHTDNDHEHEIQEWEGQ